MGHSLGDSIRRYDKDQDGLIDASAVGINFEGWGYQDFAPGTISTTSITITANENGTGFTFDPIKIIGNSAVIALAANEDGVPYSGSTKLFSTMVKRTGHTGQQVTLNAVPHSSWGAVRVWYKYLYSSMPVGYQMAGQAIAGKLYATLDQSFITEEEFSAKVNQDVRTTATPTFAGLNVLGNITVAGSAYETHLEKVFTKNNLMYLRDGAVSGLAAGELCGFQAKLYDGINDGQLVFDNQGIARVGDVGSTQALATREDTPVSNGLAIWDSANLKFKTDSKLNFDGTDLKINANKVWHAGNTGTAGSNLIGYTPANSAGDTFSGNIICNGSVLIGSTNSAKGKLLVKSDAATFATERQDSTNRYHWTAYAADKEVWRFVDSNGAMSIFVNNIDTMRLTSNGNVLIGSTTDTGEKLQVNGSINATSFKTNSDGLVFGTNLDIYKDSINGGIVARSWGNVSVIIDADNNDPGTRYFEVVANGNAVNAVDPVFKVKENGQMELKHPYGNSTFDIYGTASQAATGIKLFRSGSTTSFWNMQSRNDSGDNAFALWSYDGTTWRNPLYIQGNAPNNILRLTNNGNILINQTTDNGTDKLQVYGSGLFTGVLKAESTKRVACGGGTTTTGTPTLNGTVTLEINGVSYKLATCS